MTDTSYPTSSPRAEYGVMGTFGQERVKPANPAESTQRSSNAQPTPGSDSQSRAVVNQMSDYHLKFKFDSDTNQVTVYILDRSTKEVVRTIPPEELSNLRAGDLLELFA